MSLHLHSGWNLVAPQTQGSVFKEASTLLNELRHLADTHPQDSLQHCLPESDQSFSLDQAYAACEAITRLHSKSFFLSSQLLPPEKRRAVRALYAFCRTSDDLVDCASGDPAAALAAWVQLMHTPARAARHPVLAAWNDTAERYGIPQELVDELLAGIAMDLTITRYATFDELWVYCYRVASVVGLLSMHIIGYQPGASEYAIKLGVALQLTNILRDVGEDARRGRVYLPLADLAHYGLTDQDILAGVQNERMTAMLEDQIRRAEQLYDDSWPGIALLSVDSQLAIGAAGAIYRGILDKIRMNRYDVFTQRARVSFWQKLRIVWAVRQRLRAKP